MANQTVYPYGTGGSLPSSIGIINDLTTGGADKALSAQQGVVLGRGAELMDIDVSFLAIRDRSISPSSGKWTSSTNNKHIILGVIPGETYRITANASEYTTYAFLTSGATPTSGGTAALVSGTEAAYYISPETTKDIVIPSGCLYLYMYSGTTASSGSGKQSQPSSVIRVVPTPQSVENLSDGFASITGKLQLAWGRGSVNHSTGVADTSTSDRAYSDYVELTGITKIRYSRVKTTASSPTWGMAFYDSEKTYISGQATLGSASNYGYTDTVIAVPEGAAYARFTCWESSIVNFYVYDAYSLGEFSKIIHEVEDLLNTVGVRERAVYPKCLYYNISPSTGEQPKVYTGTGIYATVRYIAVLDSKIYITLGAVRGVTVYEYGSDYGYLGYHYHADVPANTKTEIALTHTNTAFVKVQMLIDSVSYTGDAKTTLKVEGKFPDEWDVFNVRSSDYGYKNITVAVRVTDPTCCDTETDSVQDASQILPDYGVICLPTQYTNTGKPTRLIIYCHGAAVNYATSATRFNSQDLEPQYWLAEGYAVMDIEGNPFDNENEHICIPQAMDCYVAAYKWAIEYYNLCKDGVLVGGRSMGGYNTFNLIRSQCPIPVIAACPNVPSRENFGYGDATRKAFCALHMGFVVPSGFTWTSQYITSEELAVIGDNWDKYCKSVPLYAMCTDLPTKETLLANYSGAARVAVFEKLHMMAKCPVKLFGCNQDQSCTPSETSALYYRMLLNSGQIAELRLFNTEIAAANAHHYDLQDPALRTTVTTSYGEELTNIPVVYIEMLAFWRRYEQGL